MSTLLLFNKPFQVLCQFSSPDERATLKKYIPIAKVYPAGRLDYDSEGLLLLTDNGGLQARIAHPDFKMKKTYWVQVEGQPSNAAIQALCDGVELNDGRTRPASVRRISMPDIWPRNPPIRQRVNDITQWLEIIITEGRNRQVRRMTAHVGHPTLRLIRAAIGDWRIDGIPVGHYREETINLPTPRKSPTKRTTNRTANRSRTHSRKAPHS